MSKVVVEPPAPPRRSLRIAVVTETWPPDVNGVALSLAQLVEGLRDRAHRVQVVRTRGTAHDAAAPHEVALRGLPIPCYPHLRMGLPCTRTLRQLWTQQRPDLVHIATEGPLGWSALQAARALQLPTSSDFRTHFDAYSAHYGIGWLRRPILAYLRRFHNATGCTTVPTDAQRRVLERQGLRGLVTVSRGVDSQRFCASRRSAALRRAWGAGDGDLVVACVGRLAAEKNLDTMVTTFNAIAARDPRARLVIVGDGPLRESLGAACRGRVVFAGQRSGDDLAAHYASADLLLFPSLTETFGNVTTEAMASGLPVVAFELAAAAQLIRHGVSGMLAPPGDAAAFERAALALAADPGLRRAIGSQARQAVAALGWPAVVARFEAVVMDVLRAHRPAPVIVASQTAIT